MKKINYNFFLFFLLQKLKIKKFIIIFLITK